MYNPLRMNSIINFLNENLIKVLLVFMMSMSIWAYLYYKETQQPAVTTPKFADKEDAYMKQIELFEFDKQGAPYSHLVAKNAMQYSRNDNQTIVFSLPKMILYNKPDSYWSIVARTAHVLIQPNQSLIQLQDDIEAKENTSNNMQQTIIHTKKLDIDPQNKLAHTKESIEMMQGNHKLSAVGMNADLNSNRITLLSNVKGYYEN